MKRRARETWLPWRSFYPGSDSPLADRLGPVEAATAVATAPPLIRSPVCSGNLGESRGEVALTTWETDSSFAPGEYYPIFYCYCKKRCFMFACFPALSNNRKPNQCSAQAVACFFVSLHLLCYCHFYCNVHKQPERKLCNLTKEICNESAHDYV